MENYRPVSILLMFRKYLRSKYLYFWKSVRFRSGVKTGDSIFNFTNLDFESSKKSKSHTWNFVDSMKDFDTVIHITLIRKSN